MKHPKTTYLYLLLFVILSAPLFLASCKKETNNLLPVTSDTSFLSAAFRSANPYITGNKYIFRDSATGRLDTVIVARSDYSVTGYAYLGIISYYEFYELIMNYDGHVPEQRWMRAIASNLIPADSHSLTDADNLTIFSSVKPYETIPDMVVESIHYSQVKKFHSRSTSDSSLSYYAEGDYYWADGIGMIRKSMIRHGGEKSAITLFKKL